MKKYKFGLLAVLFVLGLFIFNTNSAVAVVPGCTSSAGWSATTGESCVPTTTPPIYECKNGYDLKTGFICGCTSTKGYSSTTGVSCGKTTTPPDYQSPVISGVSGPQYLDVNQQGTWAVTAYDKNGGYLSYSVDWKDDVDNTDANSTLSTVPIISKQAVKFTHSYSQWGTYKPTFTVTNDFGQSAQTSLEVRVGNGVTPPIYECKNGLDSVTGFICGCTSTSGYSATTGVSCNPNTTPPTPVCSNGVNTVTGFVCGCTSRNGWSSTDGRSCTGCDSTSGYNILTGASCAPTTTPPIYECKNGYDVNTGFRCGCTSTSDYSSYDGKSCRIKTFPPGCTSNLGYSTTTGERCDGNSTTICTITSTLRLGSTGADVSCLQSRIGLISDGKFGPRTLIAVKAFQANAGLKADGVVGPKSISALEVAN